MLRPIATRWFEMLCPRAESVRAIGELASTGAIEIEVRPQREEDYPLKDLVAGLAEYKKLLPRYGRYWARGRFLYSPLIAAPGAVLERSLSRIQVWRGQADPLIERLQACEEERTRLLVLARIFTRLRDGALDLESLGDAGPFLESFCAIVPADADLRLPATVLHRTIPWDREHCFMLVGPRRSSEAVRQQIKSVKGRVIPHPSWLRGDVNAAQGRLGARLEQLHSEIVLIYAQLDSLFDDCDLGETLGEMSCLVWFSEHIGGLELASEHFVWVTGWTSDLNGKRLRGALDRTGTRALLRFVSPPPSSHPPQLLHNPGWLKPFEVFAKALGVPADDEADPTPLLALVVPLLFGYMFGDVGQGLVLVAVGLYLYRRVALAPLLIAGGLSATLFGFLFGSLFAREDLIPALWLHPLDAPVTVLAVPLVFAIGLLSLGQALNGLGAARRGELSRWLLADAGFLLLYLGLAGLVVSALGAWIALVGLVWYLAGAVYLQRRVLGTLAQLGHLAESGLQLLVNTLSFARVGAFALAHASLSAALVSLAEATGSLLAGMFIMVVGNLIVILLEGLVVSIQTTRLVLFEFFNRFLRGQGRVFHPLPLPPALVHGEAR
jgi:V/A-type H+-transporting ATPase subunit I